MDLPRIREDSNNDAILFSHHDGDTFWSLSLLSSFEGITYECVRKIAHKLGAELTQIVPRRGRSLTLPPDIAIEILHSYGWNDEEAIKEGIELYHQQN